MLIAKGSLHHSLCAPPPVAGARSLGSHGLAFAAEVAKVINGEGF